MATSDLTIILTIKDRSEFTRRWMKYMNDHGCTHRILIGDGGLDEQIELELRSSSTYPRLDYEYCRFKPDQSVGDYYAKLGSLLARVSTRYVLLADNDDFYDVPLLDTQVSFLNANTKYIGCRGRSVEFWVSSGGVAVLNAPVGETCTGVALEFVELDQDTAIERIEAFLYNVHRNDNFLAYYSVFRTEVLRNSWDEIASLLPMDVVLHEILLLLLLAKHGPIAGLEAQAYFRQMGTSQFSSTLTAKTSIFENLFINDAFCDFTRVAAAVGLYASPEEKTRLMKAMAFVVRRWAKGQDAAAPSFRKRVLNVVSKSPALYRMTQSVWHRERRRTGLDKIEGYITERATEVPVRRGSLS